MCAKCGHEKINHDSDGSCFVMDCEGCPNVDWDDEDLHHSPQS